MEQCYVKHIVRITERTSLMIDKVGIYYKYIDIPIGTYHNKNVNE